MWTIRWDSQNKLILPAFRKSMRANLIHLEKWQISVYWKNRLNNVDFLPIQNVGQYHFHDVTKYEEMRFRVQFGINLHGACNFSFLNTHKCKLISNWTRKAVWLLKFALKKYRKMFLEAIFFAFEQTFFRVTVQNCHCSKRYHWPTKFLMSFCQS